MALNTLVAAGNDAVSGPTKTEVEAATENRILPQATVSGTLAGNSFTANKKTAIRHSVSQTQGTSGRPTSEVFSETCGLRMAYSTSESADTGVYANGTRVPRT